MDHPCPEFYQEIPARRGVFAAGGWAAWWSKKWSVIVTLLLDYRDNNAVCYYDKPWSKDTLDDDDSDIALVTSEQSKHIVMMISRWSSDLLLFQDSWEISGYRDIQFRKHVSKVSRKCLESLTDWWLQLLTGHVKRLLWLRRQPRRSWGPLGCGLMP